MSKRETIQESYPESKMLLLPPEFDSAILGVDNNPWADVGKKAEDLPTDDQSRERVIYSVKKIIEILMTNPEMDYEMAREHFDFNISGGYVGVHTPIFAEDEDLE